MNFKYTMKVMLVFFLSIIILRSQTVLDNKGTEFFLSFLKNYTGGSTAQLHLSSSVATTVTIHYPINSPSFIQDVNLIPGIVSIVNLPNSAHLNWTSNAVNNNSVRVFTTGTNEFVCYMTNIQYVSSDAALAFPVDAQNTEYILTSYTPSSYSTGSEFSALAIYDNTIVTITPSVNITGRPAGVSFNVTLNKGQSYFNTGTTATPAGDISGTIISSDKPISVVNGDRCVNIPSTQAWCDHIFEMAHPTQSWGKVIPVSNLPQRSGSIYRIFAAEDATVVKRNGTIIATLNKGMFFETASLPGNQLFEGDQPIFVVQYMTGITAPGSVDGDPAMGNMIPSDQYLNSYTFSTVGGEQFDSNFVSIIAQNSDIGTSLLLDGNILPAGSFTPIAGTTLSSGYFSLTSGSHTTSSANPFGITVEGYNQFDSYLYSGGARFGFINQAGDENLPICEVSYNNKTANGTATDNQENDRGIYFVELGQGSTNLTLNVATFVPGNPSVTYNVELTNPNEPGTGSVVVTDGGGNVCSSEINIQLNINIQAPTEQDHDIMLSNIRTTSVNVQWTKGNGEGSFVELKPDPVAFIDYPVNKNVYPSFNSNYSLAPLCGHAKIVYYGTGNSFTLTGLRRATVYRIRSFAYNGSPSAGTAMYNHNTAFLNPITIRTANGRDVDFEADNSAGFFQIDGVHPNPAKESIEFQLNVPESSTYTIEIFNDAGELVLSHFTSNILNVGEHSIKIATNYLTSGSYSILVRSGSDFAIQNFIIVK